MKKNIRIIFEIMSIFIFIVPTFVQPVHAKTLGDLKAELEAKRQELLENKKNQNLTEQEIANTNKEIENIKKTIEQTFVDIANLSNEIEKLNEEITEKDKQMKDIVNFVQVSSGESAYLEYAFGAADFTDFIYRMAVSEQLANYNEKLIEEFNQMIEENKSKQREIEVKRIELAKKQEALEEKVKSLGQELQAITDTAIDIEDEIEYQKEIIELYISKGCDEDEDIATCGREVLPAGTAFYRPVVSGVITSEFGYRNLGSGWHEGIDFGVSQGTSVYAVANGMVATIFVKHSQGGNMVIVHHNINGKEYTSVYAHLLTINVSIGQIVDRNTLIGLSGGGKNTMAPNNICGLPGGTGWDKNTCGEHLHLTTANGLYGSSKKYNFYYLNYVAAFNPREVINLPAKGVRFTDRLTKY